jgi:integrase
MAMLLREFLTDRYAPLRNVSQRTVSMISQTLDRVDRFLGRPATVEDLTDLQIAQFLRWRAQQPWKGRMPSPATIAKDRNHLASLAELAARKKLLGEFVVIAKIKVPLRAPRGYTVEEVSAMVRAARHRYGRIGDVPASWLWTSLIWAAWCSGERIGALLRVRWEDVDLDRASLVLRGENRKDHVSTIERSLSPELVALLRTMAKPAGLVWPWLEHRNENSIYASLRLLCAAAGVQAKGFHSIRKASGSYVAAAGGDASEHLGHRNPKTTRDHYLDPRIIGRKSALTLLPPLDLDEDGTVILD